MAGLSSKRYMRELYNQRHAKCRYCEPSREDVLSQSQSGRRRNRVKPLFHPRPWMNQGVCLNGRCEKRNRYSPNLTQELAARNLRSQLMRTLRIMQDRVSFIEEHFQDGEGFVSEAINYIQNGYFRH